MIRSLVRSSGWWWVVRSRRRKIRRRRRRRSLNDPIFGLVHARHEGGGEEGWKRRMESKRPVLFRSAISWIGIFEGISIFPRSFEISWKLLRLTDSGGFSRNANGPPSSQSFAPLLPVRAPQLFISTKRNETSLRDRPVLFS